MERFIFSREQMEDEIRIEAQTLFSEQKPLKISSIFFFSRENSLIQEEKRLASKGLKTGFMQILMRKR